MQDRRVHGLPEAAVIHMAIGGVVADEFMVDALQAAQGAVKHSSPNPRVGCVITDTSGYSLGVGYTQCAGGPHAEIMALRDATANGHDVRGAIAHVTLEPCSHHGRTGPCCDALIAAGIKKVVASIADPNPLVSGQGFARLRAAGIEVEVGPGAAESRELNIGFFSRMIRRTPWVRLKMAASLDGTTALDNGQSQWITGEAARADGHAWRARACAVLTGIGTVLEDNPRLDVRGLQTPRQPHLVVVDSQLETPLDAHIFMADRAVWIYAASPNPDRQKALEAAGATVTFLPGPHGKVDLAAMMLDLAQREVNELHVEAGSKLNASLIREGLVDELVLYLAPLLLGPGRSIASLDPLSQLNELPNARKLRFVSTNMVGDDLRVVARVVGHDQF